MFLYRHNGKPCFWPQSPSTIPNLQRALSADGNQTMSSQDIITINRHLWAKQSNPSPPCCFWELWSLENLIICLNNLSYFTKDQTSKDQVKLFQDNHSRGLDWKKNALFSLFCKKFQRKNRIRKNKTDPGTLFPLLQCNLGRFLGFLVSPQITLNWCKGSTA